LEIFHPPPFFHWLRGMILDRVISAVRFFPGPLPLIASPLSPLSCSVLRLWLYVFFPFFSPPTSPFTHHLKRLRSLLHTLVALGSICCVDQKRAPPSSFFLLMASDSSPPSSFFFQDSCELTPPSSAGRIERPPPLPDPLPSFQYWPVTFIAFFHTSSPKTRPNNSPWKEPPCLFPSPSSPASPSSSPLPPFPIPPPSPVCVNPMRPLAFSSKPRTRSVDPSLAGLLSGEPLVSSFPNLD